MYAQKYRKEYDGNVIWLNSEDVNSFATSLKTLAKKHLNLNDKLLREMKESELLQMVCDHFSDKKCLIILDNVEIERFNVLASFPKDQPPDSMIPSLLITSRCTVWEFGIEVLSLGVLTEEEAVAFVQKFIATAHKDIEKIRSLIRVLQCLPLALQQAVAYIRQELKLSKDPITKYLGLFESEKSEDLLKYKKYCQDILEETTSVTWKITMQKIAEKEHGRLALNIMDLIAYFEPDNIPFVLFAGLELFSKEAANYSSERNVDIGTAERAVNLLVDYSMIEVDIEREVLNVHRLVQHVIRINKEKSKADEILTRAILLLNAKHDKRLVKALLPHLEGVWGHALKSTNVIKMNGRYLAPLYEELNEYGQYRTMHGLARDTKTVVWQVFGEAHEYAIDMQYYESLALFQMQMYEEANILLRKTLSRATELLGDEHFRTLSILNMFARNLRRQGEHEDQLQMIEKVYEIQLKIYGPDHTETLASLHNKGKCLLYLSRPDEALLLLQTVCEARVKLLGSEHKDTMGTRFSIAQVLEEQGKFKEALEIQEAVIEGLVRPLGAEHPQVLANLHYKAHTLLNLERLEEARELFQSVYEVRRRILGEVHPHTLTTAVWLSEVLQKQGKWIQALEFSEAVLEGRKRSLGAEHLLTLDAMNALG
jgi:tetratricopeptide (TPR) repeat protein